MIVFLYIGILRRKRKSLTLEKTNDAKTGAVPTVETEVAESDPIGPIIAYSHWFLVKILMYPPPLFHSGKQCSGQLQNDGRFDIGRPQISVLHSRLRSCPLYFFLADKGLKISLSDLRS